MKGCFIEQKAEVGSIVCLSATDSRHLVKVLREVVGAQIRVVAAETSFLAKIVATEPLVQVELLAEITESSESNLTVYLLQGIAKGEKMDYIIQKSVELGVNAIVPVACNRCVVQLKGEKAKAKVERWQKIAVAAAKQSGREKITQIMPVSTLNQAIELLPPETFIIMPWEDAETDSGGKPLGLKTVLATEPPQNVAIIIGPEGGFEKSEVEVGQKANAKIVSLGKRILRTETAAVAVVTIVMFGWGDIGGA